MSSNPPSRRDRAVSPVVGSVLMIAIVVIAAAVVGTFVTGFTPSSPAPQATMEPTANATTNTVTVVHRGGDALDVDALRLRIEINGTPLETQPPVPFFSASGFRPGPTGPFNPSTANTWVAGERASIQLASTNAPMIAPGSRVTVIIGVGNALVLERTVVA